MPSAWTFATVATLPTLADFDSFLLRYWRKPEATRETIAEGGWLKTGDIAVKGEGGVLGIVDRKKVRCGV